MKKTCLIFFLLVSASVLKAQTYVEKSETYDTRGYVQEYTDPYNPVLAGACSFLIPGLGQIICDETGRGLAFLGGSLCCTGLCIAGMIEWSSDWDRLFEASLDNPEAVYGLPTRGLGKMTLGLLGNIGISIWSIVDAVKVAKVNNLFYRNQNNTGDFNLSIRPYTDRLNLFNQTTNPVGLSLRLSF